MNLVSQTREFGYDRSSMKYNNWQNVKKKMQIDSGKEHTRFDLKYSFLPATLLNLATTLSIANANTQIVFDQINAPESKEATQAALFSGLHHVTIADLKGTGTVTRHQVISGASMVAVCKNWSFFLTATHVFHEVNLNEGEPWVLNFGVTPENQLTSIAARALVGGYPKMNSIVKDLNNKTPKGSDSNKIMKSIMNSEHPYQNFRVLPEFTAINATYVNLWDQLPSDKKKIVTDQMVAVDFALFALPIDASKAPYYFKQVKIPSKKEIKAVIDKNPRIMYVFSQGGLLSQRDDSPFPTLHMTKDARLPLADKILNSDTDTEWIQRYTNVHTCPGDSGAPIGLVVLPEAAPGRADSSSTVAVSQTSSKGPKSGPKATKTSAKSPFTKLYETYQIGLVSAGPKFCSDHSSNKTFSPNLIHPDTRAALASQYAAIQTSIANFIKSQRETGTGRGQLQDPDCPNPFKAD